MHIPDRAINIPTQFRKLLVPGKIEKILCTGNLCDQPTYNYLNAICQDIELVAGDYDIMYSLKPSSDNNLATDSVQSPKKRPFNAPLSKTVVIENFKIGLIHGHQLVPGNGNIDSLVNAARAMDVD
ncbi:hypothetical protein BB560_006032, partial [Smittium megazygosporum]